MRGIDLKDNESIVSIVRQHWLVYAISWLCVVVCVSLPSYGLRWLFAQGLWGQLVVWGSYTIGIIIFLRALLYWRSTRLVVTSDRIIDIDRQSIFHKEITQIKIQEIDDVEGKIKGVFGTIFRIGQIRIVPHRGSAVTVAHIAAPLRVQDMILELVEQKETARHLPQMNTTSVLSYLETLDTAALDTLLRAAMQILRKKKM